MMPIPASARIRETTHGGVGGRVRRAGHKGCQVACPECAALRVSVRRSPRSIIIHVDDRLSKGLRRFLRQVVADVALDGPMLLAMSLVEEGPPQMFPFHMKGADFHPLWFGSDKILQQNGLAKTLCVGKRHKLLLEG